MKKLVSIMAIGLISSFALKAITTDTACQGKKPGASCAGKTICKNGVCRSVGTCTKFGNNLLCK